VQDALDGLWKANEGAVPGEPYPAARMTHLFSLFSASLTRFMQIAVGGKKVWSGAFNEVRAALKDAIRCVRGAL
jgi:hypothetical protein